MKAYLSLAKGNLMVFTVYRLGFFFTLAGNLLYIVLIYFLWGNIFRGNPSLNGMTFNQVFVSLALANSMFILFKAYVDWAMSREIIDGGIVMRLIKPIDYQFMVMFLSLGTVLANFIFTTIPTILMLVIVFHADIPLGINLIFVPFAILMAFMLSFTIDYMVGLTAFYTESIWGLSTTKEVIVTFLSGALVPLAFFPAGAQRVLEWLPFRAIYSIPLTILTNADLGVLDYLGMLGIQLCWVVVLVGASRLWYRKALKVLTVNGG